MAKLSTNKTFIKNVPRRFLQEPHTTRPSSPVGAVAYSRKDHALTMVSRATDLRRKTLSQLAIVKQFRGSLPVFLWTVLVSAPVLLLCYHFNIVNLFFDLIQSYFFVFSAFMMYIYVMFCFVMNKKAKGSKMKKFRTADDQVFTETLHLTYNTTMTFLTACVWMQNSLRAFFFVNVLEMGDFVLFLSRGLNYSWFLFYFRLCNFVFCGAVVYLSHFYEEDVFFIIVIEGFARFCTYAYYMFRMIFLDSAIFQMRGLNFVERVQLVQHRLQFWGSVVYLLIFGQSTVLILQLVAAVHSLVCYWDYHVEEMNRWLLSDAERENFLDAFLEFCLGEQAEKKKEALLESLTGNTSSKSKSLPEPGSDVEDNELLDEKDTEISKSASRETITSMMRASSSSSTSPSIKRSSSGIVQTQPNVYFSFDSSGWMFVYHFGAALYLEDLLFRQGIKLVPAQKKRKREKNNSGSELSDSASTTSVDDDVVLEKTKKIKREPLKYDTREVSELPADTSLNSLVGASGSSGGSIAACSLLCPELNIKVLVDDLLDHAEICKWSIPTTFKTLDKFLHKYVPENAHVVCSGRQRLLLTRLGFDPPLSGQIISEWRTRDHLIGTLKASAHIPLLAGLKPWYLPEEKAWYVDGLCWGTEFVGWRTHDDKYDTVIKISALGLPRSNIRPSMFVSPLLLLFPPDKETLAGIFWGAYLDAKRYIEAQIIEDGCGKDPKVKLHQSLIRPVLPNRKMPDNLEYLLQKRDRVLRKAWFRFVLCSCCVTLFGLGVAAYFLWWSRTAYYNNGDFKSGTHEMTMTAANKHSVEQSDLFGSTTDFASGTSNDL